jgi:beta-glucuronidase
MPVIVRRSFLLFVVLAALGGALAPASAAAAPADPVELAKGWEVAYDAEGPWKRVSVPHVLEGRPVERAFDGTTAWYRLRFQGPRNPAGGWSLRFEGVRRRAEVFLNGRSLGRSVDPYTPFTLPATGLAQGRENLLTVRVDNRRTKGVREGWWNWGGITRQVKLLPRAQVAMRGVGVLGDVDCEGTCRASVVVDGWIESRADRPVRPQIALRMRAPGGGPVTQRTVRVRTIRPGETARVHFRVPVAGDPKLWGPERPQLYATTVQLRSGGQVTEQQEDRLGLRTVRAADGRLWLNGRRLDLRGASIQEDVPGRGPALGERDIDRIVSDLKAVGANVTRAHYLLDERLLDRLDEEGILVWSQAPVYHRDVQLRTPAGRERELGSLRRTVLEARRHPSVVAHSVANELSPVPDENPTTKAWLDAAREMVEDLDPTVPAAVDVLGWPSFERQETYARYDLIGINSYFGWYEGAGERSTADVRDLEPYLRRMHEQYPRSALVMTEFGAESTMDGPADVKETYAFQERYLQTVFGVVERLDFMNGALYWTLREFAVKPDWDGGAERDGIARDGIHNKGLIHYGSGERKPAWDVAAANFARRPLYASPMPRAVAPSLAEPPRAPAPSILTTAVAGGVLGVLTILAGLLLWLLRDVWRGAGRPGDDDALLQDELSERRRIRAAA